MSHCWKSHVTAQLEISNQLISSEDSDHILAVMWVVEGAQWLSGRVIDSRPKGRGFEPHRRHCVVVLEQDTFILA